VLALFGCASTQSVPQSIVSEMESASERPEPVIQAFASDVPAMDNGANVPVVQPEVAAQKPEVQLEVAAQEPDVQPEGAAQESEVQPEVRPQRAVPKATVLSKTAAPAAGSSPEMITLKFDNADIYEVIYALSDSLGINFIIDPRIKGRVTIQTAGEIDKSRLMPIMETIFEMNNIAMIEYGDFYKIIPIKEAKQQVVDFSIGRELAYVPSYDRQMIQIVPLQYVSAKEVEGLVKHFLGPGGDVFEYGRGNLVVIIERAATIRKMLRMVQAIDIDLFAHNQVRFFKIENANAQDVAAELEEVFTSIGIESTPEKGPGIKFVPVERIGGVLAISSIPGVFERVESWIEVLDTYDDMASEQVFIYFVENGKAEEIGEVLDQVYTTSGSGVSRNRRDVQSRTRKDTRSKSTNRSSRTNEDSSMLEGEVNIVVDIPTNAIITRAIPRDYEIIKRTMVTLDRIPRQVLIEVLIAEVKLDDSTAFGVEWSLLSREDGATFGGYSGDDRIGVSGSGALPGVDTIPTGFSYVFDSDRLNVFLQAQASMNKLNILSSPHILAVDNKEARIEVGEEVPIVTSEYVPLDVDSDSSTSRSVEYRSTGVILTVTPRINERGLVAMDVNQEVSKAVINTISGIESPSITNRKAETSLVVQDGQTIIIGGLIIDETSEVKSGVPFLSSIPLIGYLFGTTTTTDNKIELILLLTPHVITNFEEVDLITDEFKSKVDNLTRLINKGDEYWDAYKTDEAAVP